MKRARRAVLLVLACALVPAAPLAAGELGDIEVAPFAGLQFGGHLYNPNLARSFSIDESAVFGATLDVAIDDTWRVELLFSRQDTELRTNQAGAPRFPQIVERYMIGIQEEQGPHGPFRFFGVALLGATRLAPGLSGADSDLRFAAGLSLGTKVPVDTRFGFRFEARGFYTVVESGGAVYCTNGTCLFRFSGSGIWQGDVTAALVVRF